jgi:hypothetical protein
LSELIEVTQVTLAASGATNPRKTVIGTAHIVSIVSATHGTSIIAMDTGHRLNTEESYEELKTSLGVKVVKMDRLGET